MVQVEFWGLLVASVKTVGSIAVFASAGVLMAKLGIITSQVKQGLGQLSMNLLIPCLMFTQVLHCEHDGWPNDPCPDMRNVILSAWDLFLWPVVVVCSGYTLGMLVSRVMGVPTNFAMAAAGSVAFGNSTGLPIVLLQTITPSLVAQGVIKGDPLLYLPVYLVLSPLLQWTVGSYIFRAKRGSEPRGKQGSSNDSAKDPETGSTDMQGKLDEESEGKQDESDSTGEDHEEVLERVKTLSAQVEIENALTPALIAPRRKRDRCWAKMKHILFMFASPPVAATLLGIFVAFIRPLHNQFVHLNEDSKYGSFHGLDFCYRPLRTLGEAAVPINLLMLGANLSKGANFKALPLRTGVALSVTKMLIQPAAVAVLIYFASRVTGGQPSAKWLVALMVSLTPTANNIMVQVEVSGQDKDAMSTLIFVQYLLSPILLTISLTATSYLVQMQGFLPA